MATTTNYSWTTPDDTALVKDGASAIRSLGTSIDTTTKALNPSTTLGDIEYRSSTANTNTRLGIGSTGDILTVAGGVPTWAAPATGGMTLINTGGTTLTGASVTISSIPSTYNDLLIIIRNSRVVTNQGDPSVRINGDSTASRHGRLLSSNSTGISFNNTLWPLINQQSNGTSQSLISLRIPDYANSATWKIGHSFGVANDPTTSTNISYLQGMYAYNQTGAITSLQFVGDGGWTSGTVFVYGVK